MQQKVTHSGVSLPCIRQLALTDGALEQLLRLFDSIQDASSKLVGSLGKQKNGAQDMDFVFLFV